MGTFEVTSPSPISLLTFPSWKNIYAAVALKRAICCCCCCCVSSVMSDSVRLHRQQPTRLHHPWDSPGKNTGVGCHCLLQGMKGKSESEVAQSCPTLRDPMDWRLPGSSIHGIFQARVLEWVAIAFSERANYSPPNPIPLPPPNPLLKLNPGNQERIIRYIPDNK